MARSEAMQTRQQRVKERMRSAREVRVLEPLLEAATTKSENGEDFPRAAFAYAPDPAKPSDWKLRLWETVALKVTVKQLGLAAAAFSPGGFRGNKVQLPADAVAGVKAKIRSAYRAQGTKAADIPASVKEQFLASGILTEVVSDETGILEFLPLDEEPLVEAWVTISDTYEATIAQLRTAMRENANLFGGDPAEPWGISLEGTRPGMIVVSGTDEALFTAKWSRNEQGEIVLSDVLPVTVTLRADGKTIQTTPPRTAGVPAGPSGKDLSSLPAVAHDDTPATLGMEANEPTILPPDTEGTLVETYVARLGGGLRVLRETTDATGAKAMTIECVLGVADRPTKNARVYTRRLFENLVAESTMGTERSQRWLAEQDHPADGRARLSATVSTPWRNLAIDPGGRLLGECDIIPTAAGRDVQVQIRHGVPVQVSSRTFATTRPEQRSGQTVNVVNEAEALSHWGGWDLVLGAAADGAHVVSHTETGKPAATGLEGPGDSLDEVLETMTLEEMRKAMEQAMAEGMTTALKPLMESLQKKEDPPAPVPVVVAPPAPAVTEADEADKAWLKNFRAEQEGAVQAAVLAEALVGARTAIMETPEVVSWPDPAKKLMAAALEGAGSPEALSASFERVKRNLQEVGMLIVLKPAGTGLAAPPNVNDGSGTQDSLKERAHRFQTGGLAEKDRPTSIKEAVDLLTEGIPDNGLHSTGSPEDPITAYLGSNLPFPGYHPGNPKHQLEALLRNVIQFENGKYLRGHIKGLQEWTGVAGVAQTTPFVLPMIRQVWMRLIIRDLCSVQPMNKSTGIVHYLNFLSDPGAANFAIPGQWNSEYAQHISEQALMREVQLAITHADITMDTKKLRAEWSSEVRQNLQADHGLDIVSEMISFMSDEIAREVNALLLQDMLLGADPGGVVNAGNTNYGCLLPAAGYLNLSEWNRELYTAMLQSDALVRATRRARTNWAVAGQNALIRLMRMNNWVTLTGDAAANDWNVGINLIGSVQGNPTYQVYGADADLFPTNLILLGRRGTEWPDAGEVYCPWIPLYTSGLFVDPNTFCEREAVMSRFGYRKVVGNMFATVTTLPAAQGVPF